MASRLLTEFGGALPISDAARSLVAILDLENGNAVALYNPSDERSPAVTQALRLAELSHYRIVEHKAATPAEIAALYRNSGSSADIAIDDRAILDRLLGIIAMAAEQRSMDVKFQLHKERGIEARIFANGGFSPPVLSLPASYYDRIIQTLYNVVASDRRGTFDYTGNPEASTEAAYLMTIAPTELRETLQVVSGIRHQYAVQYGGHVVELRLHFRDAAGARLQELGFHPDQVDLIERLALRPAGMVPFVGPTGSGKSTAMRAAAIHRYEASEGRAHIVEIANPPEVADPRITLLPVTQHVGSDGHSESFGTMIPIAMRLIPTILIVQETRDRPSAQALVNASIGGHLTMTSVHASGPFQVPNRLEGLGFPQDIAYDPSVILALPYLSLLPGLCECAVPAHGTQAVTMLARLGHGPQPGYRSRRRGGCPKCGGSGYAGKQLIAEVLPTSETLMQLIRTGDRVEARKFLKHEGGSAAITISAHGLMKAADGLVDIADVLPFVEADQSC